MTFSPAHWTDADKVAIIATQVQDITMPWGAGIAELAARSPRLGRSELDGDDDDERPDNPTPRRRVRLL